ncbi:MAG: phospho-sugar mutase [Firmicutes bacterium]|nr:phospho-sugar mutase [Bacillota bacterium]
MDIMDIDIMERAFSEYTRWKTMSLPEDLTAELAAIEGDQDEIYDRFCKDIVFGTSGLRGKMGAGTNRINSVVLRKASLGISEYLTRRYSDPAVVIGYDTRINSKEYAMAVARVYADRGVKAYVFSQPTPVPVVSFAVRHLGINGGIMITASHNTKEYNGYKVYDHFGNQIDNHKAALIEKYIAEQDPFRWDPSEQPAQVVLLDHSVKQAYFEAVGRETLWWDQPENCREALKDLNVCYTPLNGSGLPYVLKVLENLGQVNVRVVESQEKADGNFPTCPSPNPENGHAFDEALKICAEDQHKYDIILATDPDSDRLGAMVYSEGQYVHLSGNQVGELMLDYVCRCHSRCVCGRSLEGNKIAFKSFVSSPLAEEIGRAYGVEVKNVFTGFKNIVLEIERLKAAGRGGDFLFGFEESLGYLYGDYTRDKDGIMAAQMLCLMAAEQKSCGKDLVKRLEEIYKQYGYTESIATSIVYKHEKDRVRMNAMLTALFDGRLKRRQPEASPVCKEICYRQQNMYCADLKGGHRVIVRPSGTELKLKIYIFAKGQSRDEAIDMAAELCSWARKTLEEE